MLKSLALKGCRSLVQQSSRIRCLSSTGDGLSSKSPLSDMLSKMDLQSKKRGGPPGGVGGGGGRGGGDRGGGDRGGGGGGGFRRGRPVDPVAQAFKTGGFRGEYASSAISLLHGDYDDFPEEDADAVSTGPGTGNPYRTRVMEDDEIERETQNEDAAGQQLLMLEKEMMRDGERKAALRLPVERHQQLDERGRAYGRGGRKTSTARVWLFPGEGNITINNLDFVDYYWHRSELRSYMIEPFLATKTCGMFDVVAKVEGGGLSGKAGAIRHGIARALQHYNPEEFRMPLKVTGMLTRDSRRVEPKKPGRKKARKLKQWVKR